LGNHSYVGKLKRYRHSYRDPCRGASKGATRSKTSSQGIWLRGSIRKKKKKFWNDRRKNSTFESTVGAGGEYHHEGPKGGRLESLQYALKGARTAAQFRENALKAARRAYSRITSSFDESIL